MKEAGSPDDEEHLPESVAALVGGRPHRTVWSNDMGGRTYEVGADPDRVFIKWVPDHPEAQDIQPEVDRLRWAIQHVTVPTVLDHGRDDAGQWMVTAAVPGDNAVVPRCKADPAATIVQLAEALRHLHETLPVDTCPFTWSIEERRALALRPERGGRPPSDWHPDFTHLTVDEAHAALDNPPPIDRLVVCHGDACAPNTLIGADGRWTGHVDMGQLGVADRWADIAIGTWSAGWNYGQEWQQPFLDAYGIELDEERTRYYRLLWDLGP